MKEITLKQVNKNVIELKRKIEHIEVLLREDFELSDHAKKALKEARETPKEDYIDLA